MASHNSKNNILLVVLLVIALGVGIYVSHKNKEQAADQGVMCTMEAKLCPDGVTYVGRTGPACEFAACPEVKVDTSTWKTSTSGGVTFKYPEKLATTYIQTVDWPPKVQAVTGITGSLSCNDAGEQDAPAGKTGTKTINGHTYCVTTEAEGAAGSTYTQYAYAWQEGDKTLYFTFTLRAPQCANYDEPKASECQKEKDTFALDPLIDAVIQTASLSS